MSSRLDRPKPNGYRPTEMRIDEQRCSKCDACIDLAPVIGLDPQHIPIFPATLDAMAECPTGALVWREATPADEDPDRAKK